MSFEARYPEIVEMEMPPEIKNISSACMECGRVEVCVHHAMELIQSVLRVSMALESPRLDMPSAQYSTLHIDDI